MLGNAKLVADALIGPRSKDRVFKELVQEGEGSLWAGFGSSPKVEIQSHLRLLVAGSSEAHLAAEV